MSYACGIGGNNRDIGYGVPARCDHPRCKAGIDRGLSYKCAGEDIDGDEIGCGLFFCMKHGGGSLCKACQTGQPNYPAKPDTLKWIAHKLLDDSWEKWRDENPATVALYEARLSELM